MMEMFKKPAEEKPGQERPREEEEILSAEERVKKIKLKIAELNDEIYNETRPDKKAQDWELKKDLEEELRKIAREELIENPNDGTSVVREAVKQEDKSKLEEVRGKIDSL